MFYMFNFEKINHTGWVWSEWSYVINLETISHRICGSAQVWSWDCLTPEPVPFSQHSNSLPKAEPQMPSSALIEAHDLQTE